MLISVGAPIGQDNLIATLPNWGPAHRVSMNLYVNSFDGDNLLRGRFAELLRFTATENNCCGIGDRIPAIFTVKGGFIQVATNINNQGNRVKNVNLNEKTWYKFELMQYIQNNKVTYVCIIKFLSISLRYF